MDAILAAWHECQVLAHLQQRARARHSADSPERQLEAVLAVRLATYAMISSRRGGAEVARLHQSPHVSHAQQHVNEFLTELFLEGARSGVFRDVIAVSAMLRARAGTHRGHAARPAEDTSRILHAAEFRMAVLHELNIQRHASQHA